jgi:hypothetical protein
MEMAAVRLLSRRTKKFIIEFVSKIDNLIRPAIADLIPRLSRRGDARQLNTPERACPIPKTGVHVSGTRSEL